jgi:hypothetical protein
MLASDSLARTLPFPFPSALGIYARMKVISASFLLVAAALLVAACESDMPPEPREQPLRRGITGQGKIVPLDQANDPMLEETSGPVTGPKY